MFQEQFRIEELKALIKHHNKKYYQEEKPEISDADYDKLMQELQALEQKFPNLLTPDSPTQKVGYKPLEKFEKVKHSKPMLSLSNAFSMEDISDFLTRIKRFLVVSEEESFNLDLFCEPKIDGLSFTARYENGELVMAATRGDGEEGENITQNIKTIKSLPKILTGDVPKILEIRGEIYLSHKEFERINNERSEAGEELFANPRNCASGSLRQLDANITASRNLQYFAYGWGEVSEQKWQTQEEAFLYFKSLGFVVNPMSQLCKNIKEIEDFYNNFYSKRAELEYDIDGLVYKINSCELQERLGFIARSPRWAIAHKFPAEQAETIIENITIQVGRTGALTPVAELKPINIGGVIVKRATLHNKDEINRKDIRIGDYVIVQRAGDVIPQIVKVITEKRDILSSKIFEFPSHCPVCNSVAIRENDDAVTRCTGGISCEAQAVEYLKYFVARDAFDIEGLGKRQIEEFYQKDFIKTPADIFTLEERNNILQIENIEGYGKISVQKLFNAIKNRRKIELARFIYSLGIRHIGQENAKLLAKNYISFQEFYRKIINICNQENGFENSPEFMELLAIDGLGEKIIKSIILYFSNEKHRAIIQDLLKYIEVEDYKESQKINSAFIGKSIIFTGTLEKLTRVEAKAKAELAGAKVASSISAKTDYLIAGADAGSKLNKAKELNVKIISEDEFLLMLENNL
ncbi:MAG: NAD-dependent DNA ligase LigA [Rickettsiales bacterium]|nr:NAD-dependent DNA ligase LigA [Rickettsiales bacterium]